MTTFVEILIERLQKMSKNEDLIHIDGMRVGHISHPRYEITRISSLVLCLEIEAPYELTLESYKIEGSIEHIIERIKFLFLGDGK